MVAPTCNSSPWETEAERLNSSGSCGLQNETLSGREEEKEVLLMNIQKQQWWGWSSLVDQVSTQAHLGTSTCTHLCTHMHITHIHLTTLQKRLLLVGTCSLYLPAPTQAESFSSSCLK